MWLVNKGENEMPASYRKSRLEVLFVTLFFGLGFCVIGNLTIAFADDTKAPGDAKPADTKSAADTAKSPPAKANAAETPLTDRERMLLDEMEELKKRVAELEAKANGKVA